MGKCANEQIGQALKFQWGGLRHVRSGQTPPSHKEVAYYWLESVWEDENG